jgi:hypothetical protein
VEWWRPFLTRLVAADPVNTRYRQTLMLVWRDKAQAFLEVDDTKRALDALGEAVRLAEVLRDADPRDQAAQIGVLMVHYSLGNAQLQAGMRAEGEARLRQVIDEATAVLRTSPGNNFVLNELATAHLDLGSTRIRRRAADPEGCRHVADGLHAWDELAKRAQVPAESGRRRAYFEELLATCQKAR